MVSRLFWTSLLLGCSTQPALQNVVVAAPEAVEDLPGDWLQTLQVRPGQVVAEVSWGSSNRLPVGPLAAAVGPAGCLVVHEVARKTAVARAVVDNPEEASCLEERVLRPTGVQDQDRCDPHAVLFVGSRTVARLPWDEFHRIVVTDTLASVSDLFRFLRSLRSALKTSGRILVLSTRSEDLVDLTRVAPRAGLRVGAQVSVRGFHRGMWLEPIAIPPDVPRPDGGPRVIQLEEISIPCRSSGELSY